VLRFAIGAWPAIAAAIVAHLLFLLGTDHTPTQHPKVHADAIPPIAAPPAQSAPQASPMPEAAQFPAPTTPPQPRVQPAVQPAPRQLVQALTSTPIERISEHPATPATDSVVRAPVQRDAAPARVRAQTAATGYVTRHGQLPTVSELMALAQVARGTAAAALKDLRTQKGQLENTTTTTKARTNR
jgi:hypothetical protein